MPSGGTIPARGRARRRGWGSGRRARRPRRAAGRRAWRSRRGRGARARARGAHARRSATPPGLVAAPARLLRRPVVDLQPGAAEHRADRGGPRAVADHRGAAERRQAAEPLPLQHHVGPDPVGDRGGELRRGVRDAREAQRAADPDAHLVRADEDALAHALGADDRHGHHRDAGLEREPPDAALGAPERAGPDPRPLGEHEHGVAAREDRLRRLEEVLVAPPRLTGKAPSALRNHATIR